MPFTDLPLDELRRYDPAHPAPQGFDEFWHTTLEEARARPIAASFVPVDTGLRAFDTFDVTFAGFAASPIRAWLHLPAGIDVPVPAVVEYVGYGGGRGLAHERTLWAAAGYAHFVMDTRGQGSTWSAGDTPDPDGGGDPAHPGFMTRGILDPHSYYYRRVYVDAVRAVEAAAAHELVDGERVVVSGGSQGGALAIAAGSLEPSVRAVVTDVPFLSDFPRAAMIADVDPYPEIARYLRVHRDHTARVFATLAHFDVSVVGRRATAPALFSLGLMDRITPPSTVYAAFHAYGGPKELVEYPFNDHEGGGAFHEVAKLRWVADTLAALG